jgi:probable HAF family extracellular repeat protein
VVGYAETSDGNYHAFLYSSGVLTDLGTLGGPYSFAFGTNARGQVVGYADTSSGEQHAFLYSNGAMSDLNSLVDPASGWTLEHAESINDSGQIVAYGRNAAGYRHAFLLTPSPEPSTLVLLAIGLSSLLAYSWRR